MRRLSSWRPADSPVGPTRRAGFVKILSNPNSHRKVVSTGRVLRMRRSESSRMSNVDGTWEKAHGSGKLGIRARLLVLALIAIVPLVLDRVRDIGTDRAERIETASKQALRLARQGMATQNEAIVSARAFLQVIANTYAFDTSDPSSRQNCIWFLTRTAAQAPWLKVLSMVQPDGRIFCSTNLGAIGLDVSQNAHIVQAVQTGEFVVSDYFVGTKIGPSLVTALPRRDPGRRDRRGLHGASRPDLVRTRGRRGDRAAGIDCLDDGWQRNAAGTPSEPRELDRTTVQGSSARARRIGERRRASIPVRASTAFAASSASCEFRARRHVS